jgi:Holliday junction resolvase
VDYSLKASLTLKKKINRPLKFNKEQVEELIGFVKQRIATRQITYKALTAYFS